MKFKLPTRSCSVVRAALAMVCALALGQGDAFALALLPQAIPQSSSSPQSQTSDQIIPADQLDSLVAPIALYPDPLLAQILAASTYPLELVNLQQWLTQNSSLSGQAFSQAVAAQPWDPSVQAMAAFPDVVKNMATNIQWTTDLGNAFLAQESGVMDAVQRMRARAQNAGALQSTPQQVVDTKMVDNRPIVTIEQADPQVVYIPSYDPTVVYGAAPAYYPYPEYSYPAWSGAAIGFGTGIALGALWGGGGWGWHPGWGWGRGDIDINRNNAFVRNSNFYRGATGNVWRHNAAHRGNVAYGNRATAARYGGTVAGARTRGTTGTNLRQNRPTGTTGMTRPAPGSLNRGTSNFQNRSGSINRGNFSGNRGSFSGGGRSVGGGGGRRGGGGRGRR
ncbi:MAG TPA: DUF3300 domain-containing protein [Vicinamibacterales bacterium]